MNFQKECADIFEPFITKEKCFKYGETAEAPREPGKLSPHKEMWRQVKKAVPNCSIGKLIMIAGMEILVKRNNIELKANENVKEFATKMTAMLRTALRHIQQATIAKPSSPAWYLDMDIDLKAASSTRPLAEALQMGAQPQPSTRVRHKADPINLRGASIHQPEVPPIEAQPHRTATDAEMQDWD